MKNLLAKCGSFAPLAQMLLVGSLSVWSGCAPLEPSGQSLENDPKGFDGNPAPTPGPSPEPSSGPNDPGKFNQAELRLEAFTQTVYPLVRDNCKTCHASSIKPFFAATTAEAALEAIDTDHKIDVAEPEKSRLVHRLSPELHNCWSGNCVADAEKMLAAIRTFVEKQKAANPTPTPDNLMVTSAELFSAAPEKDAEITTPGTLARFAVDNDGLTAPMTVRNDDADGQVMQHLLAPVGSGGPIAPAAQGGTARYGFNVTAPGTYTVYLRLKTPNTNANGFNIQVDNGAFQTWNTAITAANWAWGRATIGQTPLSLNLAAGAHTITIKQREDGAKFNTVVLTTQLANFTGVEIGGKVSEMRFPLQDIAGKEATLICDASVFDEGTNAYMLRNMRIETTQTIKIKDVMPMINGKWNPQNATFRLVDQEVAAPGGRLSSAALIIIGEKGWAQDELSFTFGELE